MLLLCLFLLYCVTTQGVWAGNWDGDVVFGDEFNGNELNRTKWNVQTGCSPTYGAGDLECYKDSTENIQVKGGRLIIRAIPKGGNKYTSGRIRQADEGFTYGAVVSSIRLPKGEFLWPAFWMLQTDDGNNGCLYEEIDIMEYRGQRTKTIEYTAYVGRDYDHLNMLSIDHTFSFDFSERFHEFAVLWTPSKLEWYVDGEKYYEVPTDWNTWTNGSAPGNKPCKRTQLFADPFQIIFNLAVGGSFFPAEEFPKPLTEAEAKNWPRSYMEVDWVRVYQSDSRK